MSKKRAIIYICIISLITALALVFSFVSFNIAGKNYKSFVGFANAINPGLDYNGGIYAEYELNKPEDMSETDFETQFNETFERINSVIASTDVLNANIVKTEDGKIRIETANVGDNKNVLKTIGAGELKIRTSSSSTADVILSGKNVTSVFATQAQVNQWGIYIAFDNEGKIELSNATKNAASSKVTLYMFRGESENAFFQLTISSQVTDGYMFISSSSMSQTYAQNQALELYCGSLPLTPSLVGNDIYAISANLGNGALLGSAIALGALVLASLIFFAVRYRELGLMACVSMLLFVGVGLFLLQSIPVVELSVAAFAGVVLSLGLIIASHIVVFEKIRKEYALGKKIPASIRFGFKKSYITVVDFSVVAFAAGLLSYLIGLAQLKVFAITLVIGSLLSILISLVITKVLIDSYVAFNKTNAKRLNFVREEEIDEIG